MKISNQDLKKLLFLVVVSLVFLPVYFYFSYMYDPCVLAVVAEYFVLDFLSACSRL